MIARTLEHLIDVTSGLGREVEIIVVNDGSTDNTLRIARQYAQAHPIIEVVDFERNHGFGRAVRTGLHRARHPLAMFCPADYLFTRKDFDIYFSIIRHCDIVIGYRRLRRLELSLYPRLVSSAYHLLIQFFFHINFFDVNWIHMYRRDSLNSILGSSDGVFFLAETLIHARAKGHSIIGVDVEFVDRKAGNPTGLRLTTIARSIRDLLRFYISQRNTP